MTTQPEAETRAILCKVERRASDTGKATVVGYRTAAAIHHSHEDQSRLYPTDTAGKRLILARSRADTLRWPEP